MGSSAKTFATPVQRPMYIAANTAEAQLNCGTSSSGASAIAIATGTSYLGHKSPWELQNMIQPNSHSMWASKWLATVALSASSLMLSACKMVVAVQCKYVPT